MRHILVVDDEARHCDSLEDYLTQSGHRVSVAGSAERAFELAEASPVDAILLDVRLPGMDGISAIARLRQYAPESPIIIMTAFGTLDIAVSAVREGVFEYLVKPFTLKELKSVLGRAFASDSLSVEEGEPRTSDPVADAVIGRSPAMQRIFNRIALVAASDVPVLLTGESGTGKEVLARAIHRNSSRHNKRFLPVFLAALSPGLIESELFGHARGAYTGADQHRPGLLEQAAEGTVLLDELGDIPLSLQVKLLRAIEQREVTRVGEDQTRPISVRFIAATNKSLLDLIAEGTFREDLYYRLSVYHIELPPLRERREDIGELAHYFLRRVTTATACPGFSPSAMTELESRPWYGNIRELRNAIEHAAIASRGAPIAPEHLPCPIASVSGGVEANEWRSPLNRWIEERLHSIDPLKDRARLHEELLSEIEATLIEMMLVRCRQNQAAASRMLGLDPKTLRSKLSQVRASTS
ncbi:Transcriptional regulatory protein ZraR [Planctomycetes bacterium Pan216]|uniref:DNA-binding transcriptional regulator NtrC n=1 Tax=Kolteria novifilia TaxID=2527975 RepID=A0A518B4U9_9BACT|nr:Transcriptional regulatory protein ZraR [Planctomycetes bacterium Pan216]